jgi:hypothetical protein
VSADESEASLIENQEIKLPRDERTASTCLDFLISFQDTACDVAMWKKRDGHKRWGLLAEPPKDA